MSPSHAAVTQDSRITPPSSFASHPLTPPPTDEKPFTQVHRVIALFEEVRAGKDLKRDAWTEFQLSAGEYDEIKRRLRRDEDLSGYVNDKIRHDYNGETHRLVIRMPTGLHEVFIDGVEDVIRSQLKAIRSGSDKAARFAQKVRPARSTAIYFPVDGAASSKKSKYEPDASFWHEDARYPGLIIEVAYSQKRKRLGRLAEDYLLDSNASVQVVVGLDVEYGDKESRKATLSVWRTHVVNTDDGDELRVVQELEDYAFRDDVGKPTNYSGLRLWLSDFAHEELAHKEIEDDDRELIISAQQLCDCLDAAETMEGRPELLSEHSIPPSLKKRKRLETPPDQITSGDEAKYMEQEGRAAKRMAEGDSDYEHASVKYSSE